MPPRNPATPRATSHREEGNVETRQPRRRRTSRKSRDRILVTGAGGFLGRTLVDRLREDGWSLVTLSRGPLGAPPLPGEVHVTADVCSRGWERWCGECRAAIHLVGAPRPAPGSADLERVHVTATARIIEACENLKIGRLITVSAAGASADAATAFLRSKSAGESLLDGSGLDWTVVRPTVIFGAGDRFSTGLAEIVRRLPVVPVPGDGTSTFQPIGVEDTATALSALVRSDKAAHRVVELGGDERMPLNELLRRVARALGRRRPLVHLSLRLATIAARIGRRGPEPWLTDDAMTLLLSGSIAASPAADLDLPRPVQRFAALSWLTTKPTEGSTGS